MKNGALNQARTAPHTGCVTHAPSCHNPFFLVEWTLQRLRKTYALTCSLLVITNSAIRTCDFWLAWITYVYLNQISSQPVWHVQVPENSTCTSTWKFDMHLKVWHVQFDMYMYLKVWHVQFDMYKYLKVHVVRKKIRSAFSDNTFMIAHHAHWPACMQIKVKIQQTYRKQLFVLAKGDANTREQHTSVCRGPVLNLLAFELE